MTQYRSYYKIIIYPQEKERDYNITPEWLFQLCSTATHIIIWDWKGFICVLKKFLVVTVWCRFYLHHEDLHFVPKWLILLREHFTWKRSYPLLKNSQTLTSNTISKVPSKNSGRTPFCLIPQYDGGIQYKYLFPTPRSTTQQPCHTKKQKICW